MNFNEPVGKSKPPSNFITSPKALGKNGFEDNDFYESLNYSKFGSQLP
jgi:hypothetical protein